MARQRFPSSVEPHISCDGVSKLGRSMNGCTWDYTYSGNARDNATIHIFATPGNGYKFDHWEFVPEHPFESVEGGDLTATIDESFDGYKIIITAHFSKVVGPPPEEEKDSAINLMLICEPAGAGTLTGGGLRTGKVGAVAEYSVSAEVASSKVGKYVFSHWTDDEGIRHDEKSFSKSFLFHQGFTADSPEIKAFVAHFKQLTGLILRSSGSGRILHGVGQCILRDE